MKFDPEFAKAQYSQKEPEELIRIVYLEPDYLAEARELARQELVKRGISAEEAQQVAERLKQEAMAEEVAQWEAGPFSYEIQAPLLDLTFKQKMAIVSVLWMVSATGAASTLFEWNLFRGYERWVTIGGFVAAIMFANQVGPSGKEIREHRQGKRGDLGSRENEP